jgi:serine protease Do
MKKVRQLLPPILTVFLLAILLTTGCAATSHAAASATATPVYTPAPKATEGAPVVAPDTSASALAALQGTLETIYNKVSPSVVNIQVTDKQSVDTSSFGFPNIPGFSLPNSPNSQNPQDYYSYGSGSGFVWDKQGHIITNNHVIEGAVKIMVTFSDNTMVPATVVGADPDSDLAVLKVDVPADKLQPVQLADSTQVKIGELSVAIGNPFALQGTMTVGFVSALGRLLPVDSGSSTSYNIPDVIQTDAPINPGNSGGVLVDETGRVIGVTSAIISPVRASAGIGFAIPSAIVQKVVPTLIATGTYEHPYLGVSIGTLTPDFNKEMNLPADQHGALVIDVAPGSPADKAGLHGSDRQVQLDGQTLRVGGDVIVAIDGQPVNSSDNVITYLARYKEVGQTVTLDVLRNGSKQSIEVTLTARPQTSQNNGQTTNNPSNGAQLGITGLTLSPKVAEAMNLPSDQTGVLVEQIMAGSAADKANLQGSYKPVTIDGTQVLVGGDVITAVNDSAITTIEDLQAFLQQANPGDQVTMTVIRAGNTVQVPVTLGGTTP